MTVGMLLLVAGKAQMVALPWAVGVLVLLAVAVAGQVVVPLGSFSVWPFYGALLVLVAVFYVQGSRYGDRSARLLPSSATNPAKPVSGNAKASVPVSVGSPASKRPSQPIASGNAQLPAPLQRRNGIPQLPNRPTQFPNQAMRPVTGTPQPGQSQPYSPISPSPVQPGL